MAVPLPAPPLVVVMENVVRAVKDPSKYEGVLAVDLLGVKVGEEVGAEEEDWPPCDTVLSEDTLIGGERERIGVRVPVLTVLPVGTRDADESGVKVPLEEGLEVSDLLLPLKFPAVPDP